MQTVADSVLDRVVSTAEQRLRDLCAISSESGNAAGIRRVAEVITAELSRHGLQVETAEEPDAAGRLQPVLIARGPETGKQHLLLLGHMDTVLPAIDPQVQGRKLLATGALDMKGGLAMLLGALDLLAARGQKVPGDTLIVLVPDEESESLISGSATTRWSRDARLVLVLEPGQARGDGETLVAGRRGMTEWKIEIKGQPAHSGLAYWSGRSAVAAAAEWCARAQGMSRRGNGPTINIGRLVGGSSDFVRDLARHHDMLGTSRQLNVVSDLAVAEGEMRFLSEAEGDATWAELEKLTAEITARREVEAVFTKGLHVSPVNPHGPGAPLVRRVVELGAKRGFHLQVEEDRGGISFPNFIADPARTPVIDGLGPVGDGMHIRGEYLNLDSLGRRLVLLADLLATL